MTESTQTNDRQFVQEHLERGDVTGWFDVVYTQAQGNVDAVPWAHMEPRPAFAQWLQQQNIRGEDKEALVIACGLGDDAEALAERGFKVTAFDISPTAVEWCKQRFPDSRVNYLVGDLFQPQDEWLQGFDFVLEIFTVQALPIDIRAKAISAVSKLVASDGTLLVVCLGVEPDGDRTGPPWPLTQAEVDLFIQHGLKEVKFDTVDRPTAASLQGRNTYLWRIEYRSTTHELG